MEDVRAEIALIDHKILDLVKKRLDIARILGEVKIIEGLPIKDPLQEALVLNRFSSWANENNESDLIAQELAHLLMKWAIKVQLNQSSNSKP
jgi:chorismate mutase